MTHSTEGIPSDREPDERPGVDERLAGWGGAEGDPPPLSPEQQARLQEHDEPVAAADFGGAYSGDLGNAEVADESLDAPQTREPDTSLGHEGGQRYAEHERTVGE